MEKARLDGVEIEFESDGAGEPVVLIHGVAVADTYLPLMKELGAQRRFQLVRYHRRGYAGSTHSPPPVSIADQAGDCCGLMRHLGIGRAHVVGHSYGGVIALELARESPAAVHSLTLLEPALVGAVPAGARFAERLSPVIAIYRNGDKARAMGAFLETVAGVNWRAELDRALPGGFEQAVADSDTFFGVENPAIRNWSFTENDARRIRQPVLAAVGTASEPVFLEIHRLVLSWLPQAEPLEVASASHMLQMLKPREVAQGLAAFFRRHPMTT